MALKVHRNCFSSVFTCKFWTPVLCFRCSSEEAASPRQPVEGKLGLENPVMKSPRMATSLHMVTVGYSVLANFRSLADILPT